MEEMITPYELPEIKDHSFFFIDQRITPHLEAKLHQHDAWDYIMSYTGMAPEWLVTRYKLFRQAMWH